MPHGEVLELSVEVVIVGGALYAWSHSLSGLLLSRGLRASVVADLAPVNILADLAAILLGHLSATLLWHATALLLWHITALLTWY